LEWSEIQQKSYNQIHRSLKDRTILFRAFLAYICPFQSYGGAKKLERAIDCWYIQGNKSFPALIRHFIPFYTTIKRHSKVAYHNEIPRRGCFPRSRLMARKMASKGRVRENSESAKGMQTSSASPDDTGRPSSAVEAGENRWGLGRKRAAFSSTQRRLGFIDVIMFADEECADGWSCGREE